jgi:hypothetical protein
LILDSPVCDDNEEAMIDCMTADENADLAEESKFRRLVRDLEEMKNWIGSFFPPEYRY